MVKFAAWNIRGLNDPLKQKEVCSFVVSHALDFVCILETQVRASNKDKIFNSLLPGWRLIHNYDHALLGRILICGNPEKVSIDVVHSMDQAMLCHITALKDNYSFWCSVKYASDNYIDRRVLWCHLLWCENMVGQNPWFVLGDFNTTKFVNEKTGGNMMYDTTMTDFHECLFNFELANIPFLGPIFTWMNRREGAHFIARKLDRCLQNECCLDVFPNVLTEVLHPRLSDHCPLVTSLNFRPDLGRSKYYPFKFFNFLADHPAFLELVKDAWKSGVYDTPMYRLTHKLKTVKAILKSFNFHSFAKLRERVVDTRETLNQAQSALLNNMNDPLLVDNEKRCLKTFHDLACAEEGFQKQKSRIQWLKLGDHNTSFLQKSIKEMNARNVIKAITLANGCRIEDPEAIKQEVVTHFQNVMCSDGPSTDHDDYLDNLDGFTWSPQHLDTLNSMITHEEIKNVIFSINDSKPSGPYGFSSLFFKEA